MMFLIWNIKLCLCKDGRYRVTILGEGGDVKGFGRTAGEAYRDAEIKLVLKPAFTCGEDQT